VYEAAGALVASVRRTEQDQSQNVAHKLAWYLLLYLAIWQLQVALIILVQPQQRGWLWVLQVWAEFFPGMFLLGPDASLVMLMYPLGITLAVLLVRIVVGRVRAIRAR